MQTIDLHTYQQNNDYAIKQARTARSEKLLLIRLPLLTLARKRKNRATPKVQALCGLQKKTSSGCYTSREQAARAKRAPKVIVTTAESLATSPENAQRALLNHIKKGQRAIRDGARVEVKAHPLIKARAKATDQ